MADLTRPRSANLAAHAATRLSGWLAGYRPLPGIPDELFDATGRPRARWLDFLGDLSEYGEGELRSRFTLATRHIRDTGVSYRVYGEETERTWPLGPVPLIVGAAEWAGIAEGIEQRARLCEALLQDIHGEARLVANGDIPASALTGSPDFIRALRGAKPRGGRWLQVYAADLGRGPDGRWWVLGDRTQAPSGSGYELENRLVISRAFPSLYNAMNVERLAPFFEALRKGLSSAAGRSDPRIALLSPGPFSETYFEQTHLARYLGFLLVEGDDLVVRDGLCYVRTIAGLKRIDVILRRVDADFIDPLELNSASRLGVPGLLDAIRGGGVSVLNMPGSGVLESRALMGFFPRLSRTVLGETLKLPNIATWWCGQPAERALVESSSTLSIATAFNTAHVDDLVPTPRLVSDFSPAERREFARRLEERPGDYVGQEVVRLSTMPVLRDDRLEPAPFTLRVFATATADGGFQVMPGGFCRTSDQRDTRAISMGAGARTADVWVIHDTPASPFTLLANQDDVRVRRILGNLPSRAADNLFWLGRYLERAEATLRLVRGLGASLVEAEGAAHGVGATFVQLRDLLEDWGALGEEPGEPPALEVARIALHDEAAFGSAIGLAHRARRAAASLRERLSADFWSLLLELERGLTDVQSKTLTETDALARVEAALRTLAGLSGLAQENMNRTAGWRFLDVGRRIERGINICRFARMFGHTHANSDELDLLLDLADSQITYRARYLVGIARAPVLDMVVLDPFNTRSLAFQVRTLKEHLSQLPSLVEDGMLEPQLRKVVAMSCAVETEEAYDITEDRIGAFEHELLELSGAVADRYFLQGANVTPTVKLASLA
jgi:uncharacterized circularly permuted ATP-grasp superfamily protein/uncharacterized alpha-E superfamily protein